MRDFPHDLDILKECKPVYEQMEGWQADLGDATSFDTLPIKAQDYLHKLAEVSGCPIVLVSIGPRRDQTIQLKNPFDK